MRSMGEGEEGVQGEKREGAYAPGMTALINCVVPI